MQEQQGEENGDHSADRADEAAAAAVDLGPSNESNRPKQAKTVFFHRDGVAYKQPIRVAIHPNRYRGFDALLTELTDRMPELSYGVRAVFTPRGRDRVSSLDDFNNQGHYLCSTRQKRAAAPVDPNKPIAQPAWRATGKLTGGIPDPTLPSAAGATSSAAAQPPQRRAPRFHQPRREVNSYPNSDTAAGAAGDDLTGPTYAPMFKRADCKRIYVRQNGEPFKKHIVLLNKRMVQSFEQVLDDLSAIFRMQVRKVYTIDGQLVESLSAMYNGPESYVVAGQEKFKPIFAWGSADQGLQVAGAEGAGGGGVGGRKKLPPIGRRAKEMRLANAGKSKGLWRVKISTPAGDVTNGTSSRVYLTVYGRDGQSDPIPLSLPVKLDGAPANPFQAGQEDEFEISTGSIGQVTKVRLSHDSSGASPGWLAGRLIMTSEGVGSDRETLVFEFNRWLARDRDDGDTCREMAAVRDGTAALPMERYRMEVHTGDCYNAGTQAEVYIQLFGQQGDTGRRLLLKSVSNANGTASAEAPFQKGQIDVFELESVSLGPLRKVLIGHNGKGPGHGWFLDKVIVYELSAPSEGHAFLCNRWLDEGEDDGRISRELKLRDTFMQDLLERELWDYMSWAFAGGNVIQLYSKVTEKPLRINSGDTSVDAKAEERDPMSYFTVQARKADVRLFRSTAAPKCYLAIDNGQILGQGKGGALCEFRVRIQPDRSVVLESSRHSLQQINIGADGEPVDPRHWKGASTGPGKLFVPYCKGMLRHRGIVLFSTSLTQTLFVDHDNGVHGTGKRNRMSHFRVHKVEGEPGVRQFESVVFAEQFLRIKDGQCDCKGTGDIYCYFKVEKYKDKGFVTLECLGAKGLFIGFAPDGRVIATEDHGEPNVRLVPEVIQFGQSKNLDPSAAIEAANSARQEEKASAPPEIASEPLAASVEETTTTTTTEAADSPDTWRLLLDTAEACIGGRLTLFAYGDAGMVGPIAVAAAGEGALAAASQDEFQVSLAGTGPLYKLRLQLSPLVESASTAVWSVNRVQLKQSGLSDVKNVDLSFVDNGSKRLAVNGDGETADTSCLELSTRPDLGVFEYRLDLGTDMGQEVDYAGRVGVCLVGDRGDSGRRSFCGLRLSPGQTLALKLHAVDLGRLIRCHISVDVEANADEAVSPWHCGQVTVSSDSGGGINSVHFGINQQQPESRRSQGKLDYILRPIVTGLEQAVNELVSEAIDSALKEINSETEPNIREDEEPELAHLAEDPSEEPTATEEDTIDLLAKEAKFLVDDIAEQVAKRMEGLREDQDQAAAKPGDGKSQK